MKTGNFHEYLIETLKNQKTACIHLNVALEEYQKDGDIEAFLLALRDVAEARGGVSGLAVKTKLNRQNLYKVLSGKGNPTMSTLGNVLNGLGFHLMIKANR